MGEHGMVVVLMGKMAVNGADQDEDGNGDDDVNQYY